MKNRILLGIIFLLYTKILFAVNYYVDAVNGSDNNTGTSPELAWKTVNKVNTFSFYPGDVISFRAGQTWRESLICQSGLLNQPLTYTKYGAGEKPLFLASINVCHENYWVNNGNNIWSLKTEYFSTEKQDIGNIILIKKGETEKKAAWKRWSQYELHSQGDFYHDLDNDKLYFYSTNNPASVYSQMEAARKRNIFFISECQHLVIDGLQAAYTGAHGAAGENTANCTIRNCIFSWIGGSLLYWSEGKPTRYGNGIEFWNAANDNLVENNYFEQIYDVAMTNQGKEASTIKNITWKKNKTYRCEHGYETWLSNNNSQMLNVVFEYNECVDTGFGWSDEQRPDKNGAHLLSYSMNAKIFDIYYRNNIFNNTSNACIIYANSRLPEAHLDNNTYIQKGINCNKLPLFQWGGSYQVSWEKYREITGNDKNSVLTFENVTKAQFKTSALHNLNIISSYNDSCMSEGLWSGAVVLAGTADSTVFRHAWGYTSTEKTVQLPEDAIFDLASITKPVATATSIALCMDRGWIDISAPFTQYLPEYKGKLQEPITVLDLARHVSGFDSSKSFMTGGPVIENVLHCNPVCPPKQRFEYTCINYILLGLIVEKVSGKTLADFCKENIFGPLSMNDTQWSPVQKSNRVVKSTFTPEQGLASDIPARLAGRPIGNAGLFSTADDLAKFCRMMLANGKYGENQILSKKAINSLTIKTDTCSPLALGWFVEKSSNPPSLSEATISHTGWAGNTIWIDPVQQRFVIVLTNRSGNHGRAIQARAKLTELVLKEWYIKPGINREN